MRVARYLLVFLSMSLLSLQLAQFVTAQAPEATPAATGGSWQVAETRELDIGTRYAALSPDGRRLAGVGPEDTICVWDVETLESQCAGERMPIRAETITWSPDGTAVAFALDTIRLLYESDLYVYELATGEVVNLTDDGFEGDLLDVLDSDPPADDVPTWSPDSQQIAFARSFRGDEDPGSTSIMRIDRSGGEVVEVARLDVEQPFTVWMPMHWLPDGTLVYSQISNDLGDQRNGVWKVDIDGASGPGQIAQGSEDSDIPGPLVSDIANGKAIVYSYWLMAQFAFEVDQPVFWIVDLATGDREPMLTPPATNGTTPLVLEASFSPDGMTALLVTSTADGSQLMALDVATGEITPLQSEPSDVRYLPGAPQWAANDTALLQRPQGPLLLTLVPTGDRPVSSPVTSPAASSVTTGDAWQISEERELDIGTRHAVLSPDGEWLAGIGPDNILCMWEVVSLVSRCLDEQLEIRPETIAWAPDSSAVAFSLDVIRQLAESDIYVLERQPWTLMNLTDDGVEGDVFDGSDAGAPLDDVPTWSPDGQRIAFVRSAWGEETSSTSIMVIDRAGGEPTEMLPLDVDEPLAVWSPMHWLDDGTLLYSQLGQNHSDPRNGVWRVGVDDGSSPLQIVPGSEQSDIFGVVVGDADDDLALVYSYPRLMEIGFDEGDMLYWQADLASGEYTPIVVSPDEEAEPTWVISAGLSPDGATALLVTKSLKGTRLMVMDMASGGITVLDTASRETAFTVQAPVWATNDTVLLQRPEGPLLITLEEAE